MDNRWLVDLRIKKSWTQEKVAGMTGVDRSYIAKIEAGQVPSVKVAKNLGKVFRFRWQKFFDDKCDEISQNPTGTES